MEGESWVAPSNFPHGLTPRLERLLHKIPQSPSYIPLVSTITGIATVIFWGCVGFIGGATAITGLAIALPSFFIGEAIDVWKENHPRRIGKICFYGSLSLSLGGIAAIALSLFPLIRAVVSTIPIVGNITLLIWDDYQEHEEFLARGYPESPSPP